MTIDRNSWWWRQGRAGLGILACLLVAGIVLEPLQSSAWTITRDNQPELNLKSLGENLGQGTLLGVFGGFRDILADFAWLRGYDYWEVRDQPNTVAMLDLATTLNPRVQMFWINGAREIAYDIPAWALRQDPHPPPEELKKIHDKLAHDGLEFLDRGLHFLPGDFSLYLNKAEIYHDRLADEPGAIDEAAEQYRLAAESSQRFFFPMRMYINLSYQSGHKHEAYDYLRKKYPTLPDGAPDVQKGAMWQLIQLMENDLKIPEADRAHFPQPANYSADPDLELPGADPLNP